MADKLGLLGGDDAMEEEEEEDEALPEVYVGAGTGQGTSAASLAAATLPAEQQQPDLQPARKLTSPVKAGSKRMKKMSTDVKELQQAVEEAEGRIEKFQQREAAYRQALTEKEKENKELRKHLKDLAAFQSPAEAWARKVLLDPAVALEIRILHDKIAELEAAEQKWKEEAQAVQFSAESATGQRMLAQIRKLQEENADLASQVSADVKRLGEEKARLKGEISSLKESLALAESAKEELEEERSFFGTLVYTLKKQLANFQQQQQQQEEEEEEEEEKDLGQDGEEEEGGGGSAKQEEINVTEEGIGSEGSGAE